MKLTRTQVVGAVFAFRFINALLCRTFFQPDEFFQSLEVAHRLVFGYGYETWEWRTDDAGGPIRSPLHALLFVPTYWLVKNLSLDQGRFLIVAPKLVQAAVATANDVLTAKLAEALLGPGYGGVALACSLTHFFNAYAGIRALSNCTETLLSTAAMVLWPWDSHGPDHALGRLCASLFLAGLATVVRPSAVLMWFPMMVGLLKKSKGEAKVDVLAAAALMGGLTSLGCFVVDSLYFGQPTFTPAAFLKRNVFNGISLFYGASPWHYYISQGFPLVQWSQFPTTLLGLFGPPAPHEGRSAARLAYARWVLGFFLFGLSLLGHKEHRFLQPAVPLFGAFAARALVNAWMSGGARDPSRRGRPRMRLPGFAFRALTALAPALYLLLSQHRGQVEVIEALRRIPAEDLRSVGFLMPCHSTPWQSHLHREHLAPSPEGERVWMLTCEPPLSADAADHVDQADRFYRDPMSYLRRLFPDEVDPAFPAQAHQNASDSGDAAAHPAWRHTWPSHLALFQTLWESGGGDDGDGTVGGYLEKRGYRIRERIWNSRWHEDPRRKGDVLLVEWAGGVPEAAAS